MPQRKHSAEIQRSWGSGISDPQPPTPKEVRVIIAHLSPQPGTGVPCIHCVGCASCQRNDTEGVHSCCES